MCPQSDMHLAEGQLSLIGPVPEHYVEQPAIENQHARQDDHARDVADRLPWGRTKLTTRNQ